MRFYILTQSNFPQSNPYKLGRYSEGFSILLEKFGLMDYSQISWPAWEELDKISRPAVFIVPAKIARQLTPQDLQKMAKSGIDWFVEGPWNPDCDPWFGLRCTAKENRTDVSVTLSDNGLRDRISALLHGIKTPSNSGGFVDCETLAIRDRIRVHRHQSDFETTFAGINSSAAKPSWCIPTTEGSLAPHQQVLVREKNTTGANGLLLFRQDNLLVSTFEFISYLIQDYTSEVLQQQYAFSDDRYHWEVLLITELLGSIRKQVLDSGDSSLCDLASLRLCPWPYGKQYALTVRHDVDRIPRESEMPLFDGLLAAEKESMVGVSSYFLPTTADKSTIRKFESIGAEIAYHSAYLEPDGEAEIKKIQQYAQNKIKGTTVHGPRGFYGWRGAANWELAAKFDFEYCENLSAMRYFPGRAFKDTEENPLEYYPFVCLPHHLSFDRDRKNHRENEILDGIQAMARNQMYVILMNHPDMHYEALSEFLRSKLPADYFGASSLEISRWWRKTHLPENLSYVIRKITGDKIQIDFATRHPIEGLAIELPTLRRNFRVYWNNEPLPESQFQQYLTSSLTTIPGWRVWFDLPEPGGSLKIEMPNEN